ncbi:hypothetical protein QBC42DRAFT_287461 [Cladorrhinum samala]|uniref:Uncharacterized protein n=1 Tax=Cladorrhinum samala TaxID=585594 RepID=A0AAV9HL38_9PEZI|nr:hypothetical protein QBC42DRAFT_287461 [Cladorrhinum samala]
MSRGVTQQKIPMHQASSGSSQPHLHIPTKPNPMSHASEIAAQGHHAHHPQMTCGAYCKRYLFLKKETKPYPGPAGPAPSMVIRPPVYSTSQEAVAFIRAKNLVEMRKNKEMKKKKKKERKNKKKTKTARSLQL